MKTAIIGLPMVGKTSLFTILTGVHEATRVGSMEARVGITKVPDARLDALAKIFEPPKITHATVEYLDFPAISKEALRDPSYLASLRVADALAHVLRVFPSDTVPHEKGSVDPMRDFEDVEMELILSDLVVVEKRMERLDKDRKKIKSPELDQEFALLERCKATLEQNVALRTLELTRRRREADSRLPVSVAEADAVRAESRRRRRRRGCTRSKKNIAKGRWPGARNTAVTAICGKIEAELAELSPEEAREYLASYGLKESGLERLISATYALLGSDVVPDGRRNRSARLDHSDEQHARVKAAGAIHSDFEKKFIRAEVVNWQALIDHDGYPGVREKGPAAAGRQRVHRQGWRCAGDPARVGVCRCGS